MKFSHYALSAVLFFSAAALAQVGCSDGIDSTPVVTQPQTAQPFDAATVARLDAAVQNTQSTLHIPGLIVSVRVPGQGTYEIASGVAENVTNAPMQLDMHTRIGSITKTFTVTAILLLVDDKLIGLDDPVSKYLDFVPNGDNITLRELANMTSGLFSYSEDADFIAQIQADPQLPWTARQLVDIAFTHAPFFDPGTRQRYCNTNMVLLGMVVEKVTHQRIQDFIAARILTPLHLTNTSWPADNTLPTPFSHGYTTQTPDDNEADATFYYPSWSDAAGMMISTLADLQTWSRALATGSLLSAETQRQRLTYAPFGPDTMKYGLGIGYYNGWIGHAGIIPGYTTGVYYLPSSQASISIECNSDIPHVVTPGNPLVVVQPGSALFREIAKIISPNNVPNGVDFSGEDDGERF